MATESHPVISSVGRCEPGAGPAPLRKSQSLHPKALCNSDGSCSWGWTKLCSKNYILTLFFWRWKHFKSLFMWFEGRKRHDAPLHEAAESSSEVWPFSARVVVTPSRQTGCFMSFFLSFFFSSAFSCGLANTVMCPIIPLYKQFFKSSEGSLGAVCFYISANLVPLNVSWYTCLICFCDLLTYSSVSLCV